MHLQSCLSTWVKTRYKSQNNKKIICSSLAHYPHLGIARFAQFCSLSLKSPWFTCGFTRRHKFWGRWIICLYYCPHFQRLHRLFYGTGIHYWKWLGLDGRESERSTVLLWCWLSMALFPTTLWRFHLTFYFSNKNTFVAEIPFFELQQVTISSDLVIN